MLSLTPHYEDTVELKMEHLPAAWDYQSRVEPLHSGCYPVNKVL